MHIKKSFLPLLAASIALFGHSTFAFANTADCSRHSIDITIMNAEGTPEFTLHETGHPALLKAVQDKPIKHFSIGKELSYQNKDGKQISFPIDSFFADLTYKDSGYGLAITFNQTDTKAVNEIITRALDGQISDEAAQLEAGSYPATKPLTAGFNLTYGSSEAASYEFYNGYTATVVKACSTDQNISL